MRRALLVCAAITFAIACTDNITEPTPDRPLATAGTASRTGTVAFATTTTEDGLSISTDKDDYQPGDVVHLTGSGWQAGDVLDIVLTDDPLTHDPHVWSVDVGADGMFYDSSYEVDTGDLGVTFTLTATSRLTGRTLTVVFTDNQANVAMASPGVSPTPFSPNQATSNGIKDATTITVQNGTGNVNAVNVRIRSGTTITSTNLVRAFTAVDITSNLSAAFIWDGRNSSTPAAFVSDGIYTARLTQGTGGNLTEFDTDDRKRTIVVDNTNPSVGIDAIPGGTINQALTITGTTADLPAVAGAGLEKVDVTILRASDNAVLISGPATTSTNFSTWSFTYTPTEVSNQKARAKATDNAGNNTTATDFGFTVISDNRAPTAVAGGPYSADEGSATLLDGSGSSDPDAGNTLTYLWSIDFTTTSGDFVGIDAGGECKFFDPAVPADPGSATSTLQKPNIKCTDDGVFKLTLLVTDNHSASSAPAVAKLTVNNVAPTATALNTNSPVNEGSDITLSLAGAADVSSNDLGGLQYAFDCGSGYGAFSSTNSAICPTTDNGTRTVRGKIKDDDTGVSTDYSASVTINNVAPTATFNAPASVEEGTAIALSLTSPIDPSTADGSAGFHYAFDCGAGYGGAVSYATAGTSNSKNCPTTDDASLTVKGTIFDKDGGSSEYTASVTVNNAAPVVKAGPDQAGDEGQQFQLAGSFEDPGTGDTHEWTWEYAEGFHGPATCTFYDASTLSPKIKCNDDGVVYVTLSVSDDDGGEGSDKLKLTLANVAPSATGLNANTPVDEGSNINLSLAGVADLSSIDFASLHYAFECGTGDDLSTATYATAGTTNSATCPTTDNGTRTVKGRVFDKDGGMSAVYTANVIINNVAPTATFSVPVSVNEGTAIALSLTNPQDPSSADVAAGFTYAFDCGTGYAAPGSASTASCPTDDNGTRNVKAKIIDKDDGFTEYPATVTINNVAPAASFNAPSSVNEGDNIALSLTDPFDPSTVDVTAGLRYAFDCGDGAGYSAFGAASSRSCPTTDNGTRSVKGKIKDKDNGETEYTSSVTVNNVAPTITSWTPLADPVIFGSTVTFSVAFTDPGADTHKAKYDCGTGAGYGTEVGTSSPYGYSCTFSSIGQKTIKITITDDDGGATERTHTFTVAYTFSGFSAPVDRPNTMNISKVGQAIPLKWRLTDAAGRGVTGVSAIIQAYDIGCALGTSTDVVEEYAGNSGLQDLGDGYYQYNWKTPSAYLNSCKKIQLTFAAGGMGYTTREPLAFFTFKK